MTCLPGSAFCILDFKTSAGELKETAATALHMLDKNYRSATRSVVAETNTKDCTVRVIPAEEFLPANQ